MCFLDLGWTWSNHGSECIKILSYILGKRLDFTFFEYRDYECLVIWKMCVWHVFIKKTFPCKRNDKQSNTVQRVEGLFSLQQFMMWWKLGGQKVNYPPLSIKIEKVGLDVPYENEKQTRKVLTWKCQGKRKWEWP